MERTIIAQSPPIFLTVIPAKAGIQSVAAKFAILNQV